MITTLLIASLFGLDAPAEMCFSSDVKTVCCPIACIVKRSNNWDQANEILRECMKGLGCKNVEADTVELRCDCPEA